MFRDQAGIQWATLKEAALFVGLKSPSQLYKAVGNGTIEARTPKGQSRPMMVKLADVCEMRSGGADG